MRDERFSQPTLEPALRGYLGLQPLARPDLKVDHRSGALYRVSGSRQCRASRSEGIPETHVKANIFDIWLKINPLNESCPFLR